MAKNISIIKSKYGVDPSKYVVATVPNGTEDMTLLIVADEPLDDPFYFAEEIRMLLKNHSY